MGMKAENRPTDFAPDTDRRLRCQRLGSWRRAPKNRRCLCSRILRLSGRYRLIILFGTVTTSHVLGTMVHYAQFIGPVQYRRSRHRLFGGRARAAALRAVAGGRMGVARFGRRAARLALSALAGGGLSASLPAINDERSRFEFALERLGDGDHDLTPPDRIQRSWYGRERPVLRAGERWRFTVRLKRPHGFMNPGGFDYEGWLFRPRLRATGYVRPDGEARRLASTPYEYPLLRARQALADDMEQALAGRRYAGIVEALALGESRDIVAEQREVLSATGSVHLVAISGSHITLIAGLAFFVARRAWLLWPRPWAPAS